MCACTVSVHVLNGLCVACAQRAIRKSFESSTVLTIAHRIHTILDSDRIMVRPHVSLQCSPAYKIRDTDSEDGLDTSAHAVDRACRASLSVDCETEHPKRALSRIV